MNGPIRTGWKVWYLWLVLLTTTGVVAGVKSGDVPDGSRGQYVHVLGLYPEDIQGGKGRKLTALDRQPLSLNRTCNPCHDVNTIAEGWHFNATDPNAWTGRSGEPWIYADARLAMQIPLSYRPWSSTWRPQQIGLDANAFMRHFGRHHPGGPPVSGSAGANCLICHLDDPRLAPGGVGATADQVREGRFAEAATATWPGARVNVTTGEMVYDAAAFDDNNDVFLPLTRDVSSRRCAYCHSQVQVRDPHAPAHMADRDVHAEAGMTCVACHRHGLNHDMNRGDEIEALDPQRAWAGELTCRGCHLGDPSAGRPRAGRLGAPVPQHRGLPVVHFEKLTCTVCHSGPWPDARVGHVKTSRAHALGSTYALKAGEALPRIQYPVYARQPDGRIALCKVLWPAFWGTFEAGRVAPLPLDVIRSPLRRVIRRSQVPRSQGWPELEETQVVEVLTRLAEAPGVPGTPVYICGGRLYRLDAQGTLTSVEHDAARPCVWPAGHDVRPAAQALGVRGCRDCHDPESPFFYAVTPVDSPLADGRTEAMTMVTWQFSHPAPHRLFGWSFRLRGWLKAGLMGAAVLLGAVVWFALQRGLLGLARSLNRGCR
jgi:hypothetical protein